MKWTIKKGRNTREFLHSSYSIKIQRTDVKKTYSVEFSHHNEMRFQRFAKGLRELIRIVCHCRSLVKRGA